MGLPRSLPAASYKRTGTRRGNFSMSAEQLEQPQTLLADCVFDGRRFVRGLTRIELADGFIREVRQCQDAELDSGRSRHDLVDVRGHCVLPGLINSHVHISRGGMFGLLEPVSARQVAMNLRATLASGVTTIGDMGCSAPFVRALRELTDQSASAGPGISCAGPVLTAPDGYPLDWLPGIYAKLGVALTCGSDKTARQAVQRVAEAGMNHVKLAVMHRSYADQPLPAIELPVAQALVDEAHQLGLRVLAHAHSVADYRLASDAGVDALMHSSFDPLDDDTVARVRDSGVPVCPTLWVFEAVGLGATACWHRDPRYNAAVTGAVRRQWRRFCEAWASSADVVPPGIAGGLLKTRAVEAVRTASANLALLRDAGVPISFGNDAAYGFCVHARPFDEMYAMQRSGMAISDCLSSATAEAAWLLGLDDRGTLEAGKRADLLVVADNLDTDLSALEHATLVVRGGQIIGEPSWLSRSATLARTTAAVAKGLAATVSDAIRAG